MPASSRRVEERGHDAGPGLAEGVAEGDGAALDVELVPADAEVLGRGDDLGGEGLVDLDQVDVVDGHAGPLRGPGGRPRPGPRPMISGLSPVTPLATMRASGVMPSSRGLGVAHHDHRRRAVVERAGVARP